MARRKKGPKPLPPELQVRILPRIKRVVRGGKTYYYFDTTQNGGRRTYMRLPDPSSPDFESAYSMIHALMRGAEIDPFAQPGKLLLPGTDRAYQCYLHPNGRRRNRAHRPPSSPPSDHREGRGMSAEGERGWLIELDRENAIQYFMLGDRSWTRDSTKALRFAREVDARSFVEHLGILSDRIAEHAWG
jgi:hypothetical protein